MVCKVKSICGMGFFSWTARIVCSICSLAGPSMFERGKLCQQVIACLRGEGGKMLSEGAVSRFREVDGDVSYEAETEVGGRLRCGIRVRFLDFCLLCVCECECECVSVKGGVIVAEYGWVLLARDGMESGKGTSRGLVDVRR
jgi:hypothetical protein